MNDDDTLDPQDTDDLLAAEYVLGLLEPGDWQRAQQRASVDGAFAARVQAWEVRLAPLNDSYPETPPPDLLPRIEAELFTARPSRRNWFMGLGLGTLAAAALVLALFVGVPTSPPAPPSLQAELVDEARGLTLRVDYAPQTEALIVNASGPAPDTGSVYELWVIDDTGQPRSLGVLSDEGTLLQAALQAGQTLAVSLEPQGGSPEPVPTGPVLATALLN